MSFWMLKSEHAAHWDVYQFNKMRIIPFIWFGIQTIIGSPDVQGLERFTIISCIK